MSEIASAEEPGVLTYTFNNRSPVALDDLAKSLNALSLSYEEYLLGMGQALPEDGVKLYVRQLRSGSIVADLQAIADQAHLIFGEGGILETAKDYFGYAKTLVGFVNHLNELVQWFLGLPTLKRQPPTKREAGNVIKTRKAASTNGAAKTLAKIRCDIRECAVSPG